ncbi:hypothetical protein BOX15_Mlig008614g2 [Macrostomum lignano]|nr:hypothetical protein BOX15_Mlig008614g2 [Macrostomum lignano]
MDAQLLASLADSHCSIPTEHSRVYKDECLYSCDNPESPNGLFICLKSFHGVGLDFLPLYYSRFGHRLYLQHRRIRRWKEVPANVVEDPPAKKPTRLAIGTADGFAGNESQYSFEESNSLYLMPEAVAMPLPNDCLPERIRLSIDGVLAAQSAHTLELLAQASNTWEGETRQESKHASSLVQLDNGIKIPPSGWQCAKCDKRDNLWLNLTDGTILCGRRYFDGSGGNNHAVEHYENTGYPLAVKLGTICAQGADVYSYAEDNMVLDSKLEQHLKHFGIDLNAMRKVDKTMNELEIEANMREWDSIQETGKALVPAGGPGLTGLRNLGNSCYINSVLQLLFAVPSFVRRYYDGRSGILERERSDPVSSLDIQLAKLADGLLSGKYSAPAKGQQPEQPPKPGDLAPAYGIRPQMLRTLVGRGHPEFSTSRQQDSFEFFLHLLTLVERSSSLAQADNPGRVFAFDVEDRLQCGQSGQVAYKSRRELSLSFPIPLDGAGTGDSGAPPPRVSLKACLEAFGAVECIEDFYSPATKAKGPASKQSRLASFTDYLLLHARKFTIDNNWCPKKLDVELDVPEFIDIGFLRGCGGLQPGEVELKFPADQPKSAAEQVDPSLVAQVRELGFSENGATRAVLATKGGGLEAALNWAMDHSQDADFDLPPQQLQQQQQKQKTAGFEPNPEALATIVSMGFTQEQASRALSQTDNNPERAVDWIFSHMDELNAPADEAPPAAAAAADTGALTDGPPSYRLLGFISHMGASTHSGHYVCHLRRNNVWYIFNDDKVCVSEEPPKHMGYLYCYERVASA